MKTNEPIPTLALDDLLHMAASAIEDLLEHTDPNTSYYSGAWADVPGKLRAAAMLQSGNSPVVPDERAAFNAWNNDVDCPLAGRDAKSAAWLAWQSRAAMLAAAPQDTPALNSLQSVDSVAGKWIPVSERMPEDRMSVILWDAEIGEVTSGHYSHKTQTFYHCGDAIGNEITHWMPPPAAPQEPKP
ncbi:DUF551 domain-containing protein [Klebsiella michiganensis]|uniref:DUF551 domain-containing protein n=1 Tax=Klebsiella michiganensis TaxID=1134687 RepID=UPI00069E0887|nr:DUF551 domain-containing protein [Klebsiella michiganensis]UVZ84470.1 DUF551 domain-containing protein [Klebsiella michiganensis]